MDKRGGRIPLMRPAGTFIILPAKSAVKGCRSKCLSRKGLGVDRTPLAIVKLPK